MVTTAAASGLAERAWQILDTVADPEIPALSITDLGIVRDAVETLDGRGVTVTLTPTYSGCPATEVITNDVREALATAYETVEIYVVLSPAWTTDWMTERGHERLRAYGIAPPGPRSAGASAEGRNLLPLLETGAPDACPQCGSHDVTELAGFGSTPCKALWRCETCREPFDYFKAH